LPKFLVTFS